MLNGLEWCWWNNYNLSYEISIAYLFIFKIYLLKLYSTSAEGVLQPAKDVKLGKYV